MDGNFNSRFLLQTLYSYYFLYILSLWTLDHDGKMFGRNGCTSCYMVAPVFICKGKAVPLQAWSGPEGSRKLRFPDFMTTAQDGGKVVNLTHRPPLHPGNTPGTHFC